MSVTVTGAAAITAGIGPDIRGTVLRLPVIDQDIPAIAPRRRAIGLRQTAIVQAIPDMAGLLLPLFPLLEMAIRTVRVRIHRRPDLALALRLLDQQIPQEQRRVRGPARTNRAAIAHQRATCPLLSPHVRTLSPARPEAAHKAHAETRAWAVAAIEEADPVGRWWRRNLQ
jgi:hypothetical protein